MTHHYRFALVGDPVEHSRSPVIQREALRRTGLNGDYMLITADERILDDVVERLRTGDLDGVNVTMPLKGAAFVRCDLTTPEATSGSSVNTLRHHNGQIEGHSTDVAAFREIFSRMSGPLLVVGAGGSACAALTAWTGGPAAISARRPEAADVLADRFGGSVVPWGNGVPGAIVVNATPLGMGGETFPEAVLEAAGALIDLPYGERGTPAVGIARTRGLPYVDGLEFLGLQAAASFTWWTGQPVDSSWLVEVARNV